MKIDPYSLRLFLAVTELGTISAAAEREHIAAAAISKRISDLEQFLSTRLLKRSRRGIEPTPAGVALQSLSRKILNDLHNVQSYMRDYSNGARGLIRILANVSCVAQFLPTDLKGFVEHYPDVHLQLEERVSTEILRGVAENAADIGFYSDIAGDVQEGLLTLPYRDDELSVIAHAGHPLYLRRSVTAADVLEHPVVGSQIGGFINSQLMRTANALRVPCHFRMQVNSFDTVSLMVEAGMGLSVIPKRLAQRYAKALRIKPIELREPWAKRKLKICIRSTESLPEAAKLLVRHLQTLPLHRDVP